jgi:hypothetical protein
MQLNSSYKIRIFTSPIPPHHPPQRFLFSPILFRPPISFHFYISQFFFSIFFPFQDRNDFADELDNHSEEKEENQKEKKEKKRKKGGRGKAMK